ncbi:AAA family ATPase [Marinomonas posidonica]|uniref:AAA family ATPase n=1 Tax=Marinomonas posidonica TaxID=936476 RepID=UPI0037364549
MNTTPHDLYRNTADVKQAIDKIQKHLQQDKRYLIALAGGPGSGKSTLANYLAEHVNTQHPSQVACLSMDGFHLPKQALSDLPNANEAFARRGADWTFDHHKFAQYVTNIANAYQTVDCQWPSFDHALGDPIDDHISISQHTKVILIEGLYLLLPETDWQKAADYYDERWFLDVPLPIAIERLALRHQASWNLSYQQAMNRIQQNDALNAEQVAQTKIYADWLIQV